MTILQKLYVFDIPVDDLVLIYSQYIRSILEFNSNVWYSSISNEDREDIERVQQVACQIILKDDYATYSQALEKLNLQTLSDRRQMLAGRFATKYANTVVPCKTRNSVLSDEYFTGYIAKVASE